MGTADCFIAGHIWWGECEVSQENWTFVFYPVLGWISQLLGSLVADLELAKVCLLQLYIELSASCKANVFMGWGEVALRKIMAGTTGHWAKPSAGSCQEHLPLQVQLQTQYLRAVGTVWWDWYGTGIIADQDNFPVLLTTSISTKTNQNPSVWCIIIFPVSNFPQHQQE